MTTTPQEPSEQDDPQTHLHREPDHIPSSDETVGDDAGTGTDADVRPDLAHDATPETQEQPGVDPDWPQEPATGRP